MRHPGSIDPVQRMPRAAALIAMCVLSALVACSAPIASPSDSPPAASATAAGFDQKLHDELIAMLERDQLDRSGGSSGESDQARTERLKEIIAEHGWPTIDLVGKDGEDAAWTIAQHSDLDPAFQREALELLREAVALGQASPGNLAYLEDRVAVASGEPQRYGTQVGCGPTGPEPATPIADEAELEARRAEAGLEPYADYLAEMTTICAELPG
jgi:hypothetical protein